MSKINLTDLKNLMHDTLYNSEAVPTEYEGQDSKKAGSDAVRKAILDTLGLKTWDPKVMKKTHSRETVFEIIETAIGAAANGSILTDQLHGFVNYVNIPLAGTKAFTFDDPSLFKVSIIAPGHNEIDRQRMTNGRLDITVDMKSIAVYTEWETYLAGQYDFDRAVTLTAQSMAHDTALHVWKVIQHGVNALNAPFRERGPFDIVKLQSMVRDISSLTGQPCVVLGTRVALSKVSVSTAQGGMITDAMLGRLHEAGWIERIHGLQFGMLPDVRTPIEEHNVNPDFQFDDSFLMIIPGNHPLVTVVREGPVDVYERSGMMRPDNQLDWGVTYREGVGIAIPTIWGSYNIDDVVA